ncbi:MAG: Hpt domain-containing protein, partial [Spirochaetales bacterium]|nr:Hpt domain-containing protein [Spirochaetales bacterium]
MSNQNLIEMLSEFTPIDLIKQVSIMEEIDILLASNVLEDKDREVLIHVEQKFRLLIEAGPQEGIVDSIKSLTSALAFDKSKPPKKTASTNENQNIIEDMEILSSFISETTEHLDNIEAKIVSLEDNADSETINEIFRSIHTIKGVASFLGLNKIKNLSHALENLLDNIRDDKISISTNLIDILLEGCDTLNQIMDELESWASSFEDGVITEAFTPEVEIEENLMKIKTFGEKEPESKAIPEDELITPEMTKQFAEESSELLDKVEHSMLELEKDPENLKFIEE